MLKIHKSQISTYTMLFYTIEIVQRGKFDIKFCCITVLCLTAAHSAYGYTEDSSISIRPMNIILLKIDLCVLVMK